MELVMPAEWAPHDRCFMVWPGHDQVPRRVIAQTRITHAATARVLARFEPVVMIAHSGFGRQAAAACGPEIDVSEMPVGNFWIRDSGPIFAIRNRRELVAVDFQFNSWGRSLPPYKGSIGDRMCRRLGIPREPVPLVLEGGSVTVDGVGTVIAVEGSILTDNRNPGKGRSDFEAAFRRYLGAERTVWLRRGLPDDGTGGHADNIVAFVAPGRVLCQTTPPENRHLLEQAGLEVINFDLPTAPVRYLNFYIGNGCVLVPLAGTRSDRKALARITEAFPDREIVGVPGLSLAEGEGGVHCITQQQPRVPASPEAR